MKQSLFLLAVLLLGCGQVPAATKPAPTQSEARYVACVQEHGKAFGTRDEITKTQAMQAANSCKSLLRLAATELLNQRTKNVDVAKLNARGQGMLTVGFIEDHIENNALRQISADVLQLPEV